MQLNTPHSLSYRMKFKSYVTTVRYLPILSLTVVIHVYIYIHVGALRHTNLEEQLREITRELSQIKANQYNPVSGTFQNPAPSCHYTNLPPGSQSGYYYIQSSSAGNGTIRVYCDMTRRCCGSRGGWMRVADLDMTNPTQNCPSGFRLITSLKRSCGRPGSGCVSTTFPVHGVQYSRVCGRVIAYQDKTPDAFAPYYHNRQVTIDGLYVDGVSLTHGQNPRKHIWTFAAANDETRSGRSNCPCTKTDTAYTGAVPPFIGQDYFCDTGSRNGIEFIFYPDDPLWDGAGCGPTSTCCSFNNPPWFCKQLPQPTTDDIELRLCGNESLSNEDIGMENVELYIS